MSVYLLAALESNGLEAQLLRERLMELEIDVTLMDIGIEGTPLPQVIANISRNDVFTAAKTTLEQASQSDKPDETARKATEGIAALLHKAQTKHKLAGVMAIGEGSLMMLAAAAMRALPVGLPRMMVSSFAGIQMRTLVADRDIVLQSTLIKLAGINRITRPALLQAAAAMAGMVENRHVADDDDEDEDAVPDKPLVAVTMNHFTAPGAMHACELLEEAGYEPLTFQTDQHSGQAMDALIREGFIVGVIDFTPGELADEIAGGAPRAGHARTHAASIKGIPQVVSVGGLDAAHLPVALAAQPHMQDRRQQVVNESITLVRTSVEESKKIGKELGRKLAKSKGHTLIMLPKQGISMLDGEHQPFNDPGARRALFEAIYGTCGKCEVVELENHINDSDFAEAAARRLMQMLTPAD